MKPLRDTSIVFVSSRSGHTLSRVERRLLPVMRALVAEGVSVHLVCAPRGPLREPAREAGVTIVKYHLDRWNLALTRSRLRAYMRRYQPAVAVATGYDADIALRWAAHGCTVKVVSVTHCGAWPPRGVGIVGTFVRRRLDRRTRARVDAFVVDCSDLERRMIKSGIPTSHIHLDPPSIDLPTVRRDATAAVELPGEPPRIGYAGAVERSRGLGTLAAAVPDIRREHPDVSVIVAGDGVGRIGLLPAALDGRIALVGHVPSVPAALAALDICVFPSVEPGVPTSLAEAAALGRPIVASDVEGINDLLREGIDALLVQPGSPQALAAAVSSLLDDPAHARALGESARMRMVDHFAATDSIARWLRLMRELGA